MAIDPNTKKTVTGALSGFGPWGAGIGAGLTLLDNVIGGKSEEQRRREIEVEQALAQNASNRERIDMQSPEANFRQKMMMQKDARSNVAQSTANVAGGAVANSGIGSDYGSAKIAAMKASPMMAQATAGYDQQMAGAVDQRQGEETQKSQQLEQNTQQRANLSQMTDYINKQSGFNPLDGVLSGALAGSTAMNMLGSSTKTEVDPLTTGGSEAINNGTGTDGNEAPPGSNPLEPPPDPMNVLKGKNLINGIGRRGIYGGF